MNLAITLIGAAITATGLLLKSNKKELTNKPKARKKKSTDHAKSVPAKKDETNDTKPTNQTNSDSNDNKSIDLDDLGKDEKPE